MRSFIRNYISISYPLHSCFKGEKKNSIKRIEWTEERQKAFKNLKNAISSVTFRSQPDFFQPFILITDASSNCIGAILAQKDKVSGKKNNPYIFKGIG